MSCRGAAGAGGGSNYSSVGAVVTAGSVVRIRTITTGYTYDGPAAVIPRPANAAASGQGTITISGAGGFAQVDLTVAARVGGSGCEATAWLCWPDASGMCLFNTSVTCKTPQGTGPFQYLTVTVMSQITTLTNSFTYNLPKLDYILPVNGPASGGYNISIYGGGYGLEDYQPRISFAGSSCERTTYFQ